MGLLERLDRHGTLTAIALATIGGALFPRAASIVRWPRRARGKLLLAYATWQALTIYVVRFVITPRLREAVALRDRTAAELRDQLGREPTREELDERFTARLTEND